VPSTLFIEYQDAIYSTEEEYRETFPRKSGTERNQFVECQGLTPLTQRE
jgi:hypothetical protein